MKTRNNFAVKFIAFSWILTLFFGSVMAQNKVVREVSGFDNVRVSDHIKVTFKKGDKEKVTIVATGLGYDKIITETSGRQLKIRLKNGIFKDADVNVEVIYVKLRNIEAANHATLRFVEAITGDELKLKATGGGTINIEVAVEALKASLSNGGRIEIKGTAKLQEVDVNMGAKYNAYELESTNGFVKSNTNAEAVVWVDERLEATAGSKATIKYKGKPAEVKTSSSLGGKIEGNL